MPKNRKLCFKLLTNIDKLDKVRSLPGRIWIKFLRAKPGPPPAGESNEKFQKVLTDLNSKVKVVTVRLTINGKRLTERQTEKFNFYMEKSPRFRERFIQLASEAGISTNIEVK